MVMAFGVITNKRLTVFEAHLLTSVMLFSSMRYHFLPFHVPHIWDLTKAGAFRKEFRINPKTAFPSFWL